MPELRVHDIVNLETKSWLIDYSDKENPKGLHYRDEEITQKNIITPDDIIVWGGQFSMLGTSVDPNRIISYLPEPYLGPSLPFSSVLYTYNPVHSNFEIKIENETVCYLDYRLEELFGVIEKSKYILDLKDDFDEEGSEGYKKETWIRTIKFLCSFFEFALNKAFIVVPAPNIYHGPNGSIDVFWENETFELLINIPKEDIQFATYSGESTLGEKVKGQFNPSVINYGIILLFSVIK